MKREQVIQGRRISPEDVALIGEWLTVHPHWNRTRLSRELCLEWNWRNPAGRLKDMACRTLLLKLEARGQIRLPPRRTASVNGARNQCIAEMTHDQEPIQCELEALRPLQVKPRVEGGFSAHLASHLLSQVTARLSADWQGKYGHPIYLVETFVERDRFAGACYRAAGWWRVGATTGRSRNDAAFTLKVPLKEVYLKPLSAEGLRRLAS